MADYTSDRIGINLLIGNEMHNITVPRNKEKIFREAAELINERYNKYRQSYQNQSATKYNAVVMLDIAVRYLQNQGDNDTQPIMTSLAELQDEVEEALGVNKRK